MSAFHIGDISGVSAFDPKQTLATMLSTTALIARRRGVRMWVVLSLIFLVGLISGRGVDVARLPVTLTALLLTLIGSGVWLISVPGTGGCAGGTCIADGYVFLIVLVIFTGVLGYVVGGILCSLEESGTIPEAKVRMGIRWTCGVAIVGMVASMIFHWLSVGASLAP